MQTARPILITGSNGRIGRVLQQVWPQLPHPGFAPIWQARTSAKPPETHLNWDMLAAPYRGPDLSGGVLLNLAGVTPGTAKDAAKDMADNTALAMAACTTAQTMGLRHIFIVSSAAVYGPGDGVDLTEDAPLSPANPYGHAKLEMERQVLAWHARQPAPPRLTILRIGNIVGLDALIGAAQPGVETLLDPVDNAPGGPVRSYIGPRSLAQVLAQLCSAAITAHPLPAILNITAAPAVAMADLLAAAGQPWRYGPANPAVIARVVLSADRLTTLFPHPPTTPAAMIAEWRSLQRAPR